MKTELSPALVARLEARLRRRTGPPLTIDQAMETALTWALNKMGEPESTEVPTMRVLFSVERIPTVSPALSEDDPFAEAAEGDTPSPLPTTHEPSRVDLPALWAQMCPLLVEKVGQEAFDIWFKTLRFMAYDAGYALFHGPNPVFVDTLKTKNFDRYALAPTITKITGEQVKVLVEVSPEFEGKQAAIDRELEARATIAAVKQQKTAQDIETIKAFYQSGTPDAAKKIEAMLLDDPELQEKVPPLLRKGVETLISGVVSGAAYQAGKESAGKWGQRSTPVKQWSRPPVKGEHT